MRPTVLAIALVLTTGAAPPSGDAVIRAGSGDTKIVITTTTRLAGAIHSLKYRGVEYVDSADHGRQIQSASNFDAGGPFIPEVFNPTEAGSMRDGAGPTSSSRLLKLRASGNVLETESLMAFWLAPGERSAGHPARNTTILSDHRLKKRVTIGHTGHPNVIAYDVTFTVPKNEHHTYAQFEAVTGYMPDRFRRFWKFDTATKRLLPLDPGPGEQPAPVALSTVDGTSAMAIYSPDQPSPGFASAGYGRFAFPDQHVYKWNCVFRVKNPAGIPPGDYPFRCRTIVGTLREVEATLSELAAGDDARE